METRKIWLAALVALMGSALVTPGSVEGQTQVQAADYEAYALEARVWLDRGAEPVLRRGDRVRVYYRTSEDAYVSIFHIDTNGTVRLVFPSAPSENHYARGGRDYRLLFPESSYWFVRDYPGMGYFFAVASPIPFDFSALRYSHYDGGWDLTQVGRQLYTDPYVAMDDYVAAVIPEWEYTAYALDFTAYSVGEAHTYPRFLCYDCHGFRPYQSWNPYHYTCTSFRLMIWDDPFYYPYSRYRGTRVVYVQPPRPRDPRFVFKERADGEPGVPVVRTRPGNTPVADRPGVAGDPAPRRTVPGGGVSSGNTAARRPTSVVPSRVGGTAAAARRTNPAAERVTPPATEAQRRPVLERRPVTTGTAGTTTRSSTKVKPKRTGGTGGETNGASVLRFTRPLGTATRPSTRTSTTRGTTANRGSATTGRTGGTTVRPSTTTRTGGSSSAARSGGSSSTSRTTVRRPTTARSSGATSSARSGGSSSTSRTTVRSSGARSSGSTSSARSGGSSGGSRTTVRSSGARSSGTTARARSGGSSGSSRTTVRRTGGG